MSKHFADDFSYGEKAEKLAREGEKGLKKLAKKEKNKKLDKESNKWLKEIEKFIKKL